MTYYVIDGVNPEQWQAPKLGIGRRKGGGQYPMAYPVDQMIVYQHTIKEVLEMKYRGIGPLIQARPLMCTFWYWRSLNFGGQSRKRADVTNMNKCLEDALQGVLFPNDRVGLHPNEITIGEFAEVITRLVGATVGVVYEPLPQDDPKQRRPDISKAKRVLGWEPKVDLDAGLRETVKYFQKLQTAAA